jgi:hypothetical protein
MTPLLRWAVAVRLVLAAVLTFIDPSIFALIAVALLLPR